MYDISQKVNTITLSITYILKENIITVMLFPKKNIVSVRHLYK